MTEDTARLKDKIRERVLRANTTIPTDGYPYPINVIVEPTNICNLKCVMCPSPMQTRPRGVMSPEIWKKIVDDVVTNSHETCIWPAVMGEGLTAKETFLEMLEYACSKGAKVVWNTNAVLLKDKWIDRIARLELREIVVGLDAATADVYRQIRVRGNFDRAVTNVLNLLERAHPHTKITLQFIEQEANREQSEAFKQFWLSKGAVVKMRPRLGWGDGVDSPDLRLGQEERVGPCPWLMRTISIHWNGNAVQCDADWDQHFPVGNIQDHTIQELWNGKLAERRRKHQALDFSFELCQSCNDWQAGVSDVFYPHAGSRHADRPVR